MKYKFLLFLLLSFFFSLAQGDSIREIEPGRETSFGNYELLVIAILGLLLLVGLRFWFRRTRKH